MPPIDGVDMPESWRGLQGVMGLFEGPGVGLWGGGLLECKQWVALNHPQTHSQSHSS